MRTFLAFLRILALVSLILIIHDPEWVSANTPLNLVSMPSADFHWLMLGLPAGVLAAELLSVLISIVWMGTGQAATEARDKVANRYIPKTEWSAEIQKLNVKHAGDKRGQHNPGFAISRSARLKRVLVVLEDGDWNYFAQTSFSTLTVSRLERYEQLIEEAKLKLMHEYIVSMRQSGPAQHEGQEAERRAMEEAQAAEQAALASSNGASAPALATSAK